MKDSITVSPFDEGYKASLNNKSLSSCPYAKSTLAAKSWVSGWNAAYIQAVKA